jgi:peroxiredoxin
MYSSGSIATIALDRLACSSFHSFARAKDGYQEFKGEAMRKFIFTVISVLFISTVACPVKASEEVGAQGQTTNLPGEVGGSSSERPMQEDVAIPAKTAIPRGHEKIQVGQPYLDFVASTLTGGEVRLSKLIGAKVILLHFWGVRCPPCLDEFRLTEDLQRRYGGRGLQVIGVNTDQIDADRLAQAMADRGLDPSYPIVLDPELRVSKQYTNYLVPLSVLIDGRGRVQAVHTGYKPKIDPVIVKEVEQLLGSSTLGARKVPEIGRSYLQVDSVPRQVKLRNGKDFDRGDPAACLLPPTITFLEADPDKAPPCTPGRSRG